MRFPLIPGHEPAGVVAAVGSGVRNVREGDEVIVQPSGYCGLCRNCRLGLTHYCDHAYTTGGDGPEDVRPGSFAALVYESRLVMAHATIAWLEAERERGAPASAGHTG